MIVGLEPFFQVEILVHPAASRVHNQKRHAKCLSFFQIAFNEPCPLLLRCQRHLGVTIAGQIDEVEAVIYAVEVDGLGTARRVAGKSEALNPCYRIDEAGLADVTSPKKGDLGQPVGREVLGFICAKDEFCFQVYYTRRGEIVYGRVSSIVLFFRVAWAQGNGAYEISRILDV